MVVHRAGMLAFGAPRGVVKDERELRLGDARLGGTERTRGPVVDEGAPRKEWSRRGGFGDARGAVGEGETRL